jgi:hypothetical protein
MITHDIFPGSRVVSIKSLKGRNGNHAPPHDPGSPDFLQKGTPVGKGSRWETKDVPLQVPQGVAQKRSGTVKMAVGGRSNTKNNVRECKNRELFGDKEND